jgi:hypothetical protein
LLGGTNQRFTPTQKGRIPPGVIDYLLGKGVSERPKNHHANVWKKVTPPPTEPNRVELDPRFLHDIPSYRTNKIRKVGEHLQLLLKVDVNTADRAWKTISHSGRHRCGSQPGTKRSFERFAHGKCPGTPQFCDCERSTIGGGKRTTKLTMFFEQNVAGQTLPQKRSFHAEFYEAEIATDAILSFPWMAQHKIMVLQ